MTEVTDNPILFFQALKSIKKKTQFNGKNEIIMSNDSPSKIQSVRRANLPGVSSYERKNS